MYSNPNHRAGYTKVHYYYYIALLILLLRSFHVKMCKLLAFHHKTNVISYHQVKMSSAAKSLCFDNEAYSRIKIESSIKNPAAQLNSKPTNRAQDQYNRWNRMQFLYDISKISLITQYLQFRNESKWEIRKRFANRHSSSALWGDKHFDWLFSDCCCCSLCVPVWQGRNCHIS